jgi:hypothetical protein
MSDHHLGTKHRYTSYNAPMNEFICSSVGGGAPTTPGIHSGRRWKSWRRRLLLSAVRGESQPMPSSRTNGTSADHDGDFESTRRISSSPIIACRLAAVPPKSPMQGIRLAQEEISGRRATTVLISNDHYHQEHRQCHPSNDSNIWNSAAIPSLFGSGSDPLLQ